MRDVVSTLPQFCKSFFRGIQDSTSSRTRLAYAYDIRVFFEYMHENNSYCQKIDIVDFPISILDQITREDIEEYMDYITYYVKDGKEITNDERGKKRKLSALKSFYKYYYCAELIKTNPAQLVSLPKIHEKEIMETYQAVQPDYTVYFYDKDNEKSWSGSSSIMSDENDYYIEYGFGYSKYIHESLGVVQELETFVPNEDSIKINILNKRDLLSFFMIKILLLSVFPFYIPVPKRP